MGSWTTFENPGDNRLHNKVNLQSDMEGASKGRLAKIAFSPHFQNTGNLKIIQYKV